MKKSNSILAIALILLALPSLAFLTKSGQFTNARPDSSIANSIVVTPDTAELVGQVNVAGLPTPSSGGLDGQVNPLPLLLPSQSVQNAASKSSGSGSQQPATFPVDTLQTGNSYLHVQKAIAGTPGTNPNPCRCSPPDMGLAASNKFVVQMVNLAGTIYRTDGSTVQTFALTDFWFIPNLGGPLGLGMSDPQVLYNARAGHWFADIIGAYYVNRVYFAVSATNDPTGTWYIYRVIADSGNPANSRVLPDQPWIGYSDDKFLIAANDFQYDLTFTTAAYRGAQYWILNSAEMFAGNRFIDTATITPSSTDFRIDPTPTLSATTTAYMAENCMTITPLVLVNNCPPSTSSGGIDVFTVTGTPPGPTAVSETTVSTAITGFPTSADQPGSSASLATNDNRMTSAVWQNNILWTALNDGNAANGGQCPGSIASCVRLDEISTVGATPTLLQDFDFVTQSGSTIGSTFYGAVSTDSTNDLVVVYATSSSIVYPTLQVTSQLSTAAPDTLSPSRTIAAGTADDLSTRFGDYFYAATQPNTPSTFWVSGEYRTITLFQGWSTEIGQVTV